MSNGERSRSSGAGHARQDSGARPAPAPAPAPVDVDASARRARESGARHAHWELWTGLAGDMFVGALLDAGWPERDLHALVDALAIPDLAVRVERREHRGLVGRGIVVTGPPEPPHRGLPEIREILERATIPEHVRDRALAVFARLAEAEARVHGVPIEDVHFHEVGALDAIVDITAAVAGLAALGIGRLTCGAVPLGGGTVETAHGTLPVPAPATALLLEGWPVRPTPWLGEFLTPTAAALLRELAEPAESLPGFRLERIGHGAGTRSHPALPNLARLWVGTPLVAQAAVSDDVTVQPVTVLETQIDDMSGEDLAILAESLREAGAREVYFTSIQMKKGRPGVRLTAIVRPEERGEVLGRMLAGSSTLGVRERLESRVELPRASRRLESPWGPVRVKWARGPAGIRRKVEADDVARIAAETSLTPVEVRTRVEDWLDVERIEAPWASAADGNERSRRPGSIGTNAGPSSKER